MKVTITIPPEWEAQFTAAVDATTLSRSMYVLRAVQVTANIQIIETPISDSDLGLMVRATEFRNDITLALAMSRTGNRLTPAKVEAILKLWRWKRRGKTKWIRV